MAARQVPRDLAASVRARLHNVAKARNVEFQLVLSEFAVERLLYRLGVSPHASEFVLKGAMLFRLWTAQRGRATWDLDLLGRGGSTVENIVATVQNLCSIPADDGIRFDPDSIRGEVIRAADEDAGVRVRLVAHLQHARIPVQIDVGFDDVVTPRELLVTYPTLLDIPAPRILAYPRETVVAEKLEAIVSLGITTSRMKDFYDLRVLAWSFPFEGASLASAIRATFINRGTPIPSGEPLALTREFLGSPDRQTQWRAFLHRGRLDGPASAVALSDDLRLFCGPLLASLRAHGDFSGTWSSGGPWAQADQET
ncbi:MAG: nucleotidyl transferase AbiEii/AbiGii toxin family protein [Patescibacteria group bacterium]